MEMMKLYGVNPDGSTTLIGEAPMSINMKIREIVPQYFSEDWAQESCEGAMADLIAFLRKQGLISTEAF